MSKQYDAIPHVMQEFIKAQKIYFVGTAGHEGRINVSPKGMDSLRILDEHTVRWLNVTGSGNETAAHVLENQRMTIMFCAFDEKPMILRLYGKAKTVHTTDEEWQQWAADFPALPGARQIFELNVDLVQTSCGFAVPFFEFKNERAQLNQWAEKKGNQGIEDYWQTNNVASLDDKPTNIK